MTITVDWQAELRGVPLGAGTSYILTGQITGLGLPGPRTSDAERGLSPGDVFGFDVDARRVLTVPIGVNGADAAAGWALLETLKTAWATSTVDVPFDLRLPGFSSVARRYYGRPRGIEVDLTLLRLGYIDVLATFEADPYAYGPEVVVALADGDTVVTSLGSAPSDRYSIELAVTEAYVTLDNSAEDEPALTLVDVPTPAILDGRARTVVDDGGVDRYGHLAPGSGWPVLFPGANTLSLSGATGTLTYRPAYR